MKVMTTTAIVRNLVAAVALCLSAAASASVIYSGTFGNLAASAEFEIVGGNLEITLTNTSTTDALIPVDVLTTFFFSIDGDPSLTPVSALLDGGSTVLFGPSNGGNVGGEWAYTTATTEYGMNQGIGSAGLGIFGNANFGVTNLQGPLGVNGLQYGLTSATDNPATGNAPMTGGFALIQNSVVFTLSGLPTDFALTDITGVVFQYGTALDEGHFDGDCAPTDPNCSDLDVPEPGSLALIGLGLLSLALARRRRS